MNEFYIRNVVEAALLAAGKPLQLAELGQLFDEATRPKVEDLQAGITALAADYANRGLEVKETAAGFRIQVRKEFAGEISRLWPERPAKYSRALLETLALIAYRQPITRAEIEQVRGVAVNPNIVKTLIERNWVRVVGHRDVPGRPELLGTTREFLDYFGLRSLDELPALADVKAMGDYNLQLELPNAGAIEAEGNPEGGEGAPVAGLLTNESAAATAEGAAAPAGEAAEGTETAAVVEGAEGAETAAVVEGAEGAETAAVVEGAAEGAETAGVVEGAADEGAAVETVASAGVAAGAATHEAHVADDAGSAVTAETDVHEAHVADDAGSATTAEGDASHEAHSADEHAADDRHSHGAFANFTDEAADTAADHAFAGDHAPQHTAEFDESEPAESSAASESLESLDDGSDDDVDEDELSADGHGSRELVAAPRNGDE